ncbi:MAG: ribosome maturation factor RimM [Myxococcales bacterium]|nr:MAG: ribosome maturation factor RimM [Myxococcales bacterium]
MQDTVVVGRIGRAHGIKGEVSVEPRTDEPERRFAVGSTLSAVADRAAGGVSRSLTVAGTRWHQGRLLVRFDEIRDRNDAEAARGIVLEVPLDPNESPDDPEEFYDHQLVGLQARRADGAVIGRVTSVVHGSAQDLLVIDADGREVLVPFVSALVPEVDVAGGHLTVADVPGLLEDLES